ncbi:unnamed protein product (mitochondrion) [Plasmodiophora brassicae]|uniref:YlxR domain-containing protein n=1 Tax=Plasmodiophora brassicae TaxID=37360 RepID=A0A0G4J0H9_PLABS|nr:hypothetical protein PBRA_008103 [Plasmodiophora brassicae]SPQ99399.1 unnamed protein product [Plasmodiophora brassicae]
MLQRWASLPNSSSISICRRALSTYADEVIDAYTKRLLYPNEAAVLSPMTTPVRRCTVTRRRFPRAFLIAFSAVPSRTPQGGSVTVPDGMRRRHGKGSYAFALPSVLAAKIKQSFRPGQRADAAQVLADEIRQACVKLLLSMGSWPVLADAQDTRRTLFCLAAREADRDQLRAQLAATPVQQQQQYVVFAAFTLEELQRCGIGRAEAPVDSIYRIKATKTSARLLTELNNLCVLRPDLRVAIGR